MTYRPPRKGHPPVGLRQWLNFSLTKEPNNNGDKNHQQWQGWTGDAPVGVSSRFCVSKTVEAIIVDGFSNKNLINL